LEPEEWINGLKQLDVKAIAILGAEPLLYKKFDELCASLRSHLKGPISISMTTNGWYLEKYAGTIAKHIDSLAVSLDGPTADIHDKIRGVDGSFDRAINGILLLKKKFKYKTIRISLAITPDNYMHLGAMHVFITKTLGIHQMVFNHYNYVSPLSCNFDAPGGVCKPANISGYTEEQIHQMNCNKIFEQLTKHKLFPYCYPKLSTLSDLKEYYQESPTKFVAAGRNGCRIISALLAGQRLAINPDGTIPAGGRCFDTRVFGNIGPPLVLDTKALTELNNFIIENGFPPPCQRLCCGGKLVGK